MNRMKMNHLDAQIIQELHAHYIFLLSVPWKKTRLQAKPLGRPAVIFKHFWK